MSFLNDVMSYSKTHLKKVQTETYHLNGKRYIRKPGETEETETHLIKTYPDEGENFEELGKPVHTVENRDR